MTTDKDKEVNEKEVFEIFDDKKKWDSWVNDALYNAPAWFPSSSSDVNDAWHYFARMGSGDSAIEAIEAILKEKLPMPNELVPWVLETCVAWRECNKGELRKMKTQQKLWKVFHEIYTLRMKGYTKEEATKQVAKKTRRSYKTLMETRKYPIFKEVKKSIQKHLIISYVVLKNKGRYKEAELLVVAHPNFFNTRRMIKVFPEVRDLFIKDKIISG